jgi:V/A-type H+-transporting ATPase subunit G/H
VSLLAENLAQEIREQEALAKGIIADAKAEAAKVVASAQTEAEQSIKNTRQQCHRQWRESVANAEKEAETKALDILQKGQTDAELFYEQKKKSVEEVANWLVREVMATYGSCRDV